MINNNSIKVNNENEVRTTVINFTEKIMLESDIISNNDVSIDMAKLIVLGSVKYWQYDR